MHFPLTQEMWQLPGISKQMTFVAQATGKENVLMILFFVKCVQGSFESLRKLNKWENDDVEY